MFEVQDVLVLDFGDKHIGFNVAMFQEMSDCDLVLPVSFRGHPTSFQFQAKAFQELINESLEGDALGGVSCLDEAFDCIHRKGLTILDALGLELVEPCLYAFEVIFEVVRQLRSHHFLELLWGCLSGKGDEETLALRKISALGLQRYELFLHSQIFFHFFHHRPGEM